MTEGKLYNAQRHPWVSPIILTILNVVWILLHVVGILEYNLESLIFPTIWNLAIICALQIMIDKITKKVK